jgi:hypothetical protein
VFYFFLVYIFLLSTTVIQGRHVLLLSLLLIPIFSSWIENFGIALYSRKNGRRNLLLVAVLACAYLFTDSFFSFGASKQYRTDGVLWLQEKPSQCKLLSNNSRINYFSYMNAEIIHLKEAKFSKNKFLNTADDNDLILLELNLNNEFDIMVAETLDSNWERSASFGTKNKRAVIWSNPDLSPSCNIEASQ